MCVCEFARVCVCVCVCVCILIQDRPSRLQYTVKLLPTLGGSHTLLISISKESWLQYTQCIRGLSLP